MIQFKVSAPGRLSLFGEHAGHHKRGITAGIELRTTLQFNESSCSSPSSILQIDFPQINLFHEVSLEKFQRFYNDCVMNIELLREAVLEFTIDLYRTADQRIIIQAFYYLLVYIAYKEQIVIKSFTMYLSTELMMDDEFVSPASFTVCLAACLLRWSCLQKGICVIFDNINLDKVVSYACYEGISKFGMVDVIVCTHGTIVEYEIDDKTETLRLTPLFALPIITILLVDSKQTQNLEAQTQRVTELTSMLPDTAMSIFNNINELTNLAYDSFSRLVDFYNVNDFKPEMRSTYILEQYDAMETYIRKSQKLLQLLNVSHCHLDEICSIAETHDFYGKYTDIGNGRYAYILCRPRMNGHIYTSSNSHHITLVSRDLRTRGFGVMETNLSRSGVKIESMAY